MTTDLQRHPACPLNRPDARTRPATVELPAFAVTDLPVLAPRCQLHRPAQPKACPRCRTRRRMLDARRRAEVAAGIWQGLVPAAPVAEHLRNLHESGALSYLHQAEQSGFHRYHLSLIAHGRVERLHPLTAAALLALRPSTDPLYIGKSTVINAVGVRRRIRGLIAADWTFQGLGERIGVPRQTMHQLAHAQEVTRRTADKIGALAEELWGVPGPAGGRGTALAKKHRWVGLDAWGDNIDDPAAKPRIPKPDDYIDDVKVQRAIRGAYPVKELTKAERGAAIRALVERHKTDYEIAELMRWRTSSGGNAYATVAAWRNRNGIPSGYQAARGVRFEQARVDAAVRGELPAGDLWPAERHAAVVELVGRGMSDRDIAERLAWGEDPQRGASAVQTFRSNHKIRSGRRHSNVVNEQAPQLDPVS